MKIALMCFSTARLVRTSESAIAELLFPWAISASTSRSRVVARPAASWSSAGPGPDERFDDLRVDHRPSAAPPPRRRRRAARVRGPAPSAGRRGPRSLIRATPGRTPDRRAGSARRPRPRAASRAAARPLGCPRRSRWAASGCRSRRRRDAPTLDRREQGVEVHARRDDLNPRAPSRAPARGPRARCSCPLPVRRGSPQ